MSTALTREALTRLTVVSIGVNEKAVDTSLAEKFRSLIFGARQLSRSMGTLNELKRGAKLKKKW
jgi:hypothetical protein